MVRSFRVVIFLILALVVGCQRWSKNIGEADFKKDQPEYRVKVSKTAVDKQK